MAMEMPRIPNVLLVEDAPDLAMLYQDYLRDEPINLEHVDTGRAAMAKVETAPPQAMLLDLRLPDMDGADVLQRVIQTDLPTGVLVMTAYGDIDVAVQAMRAGASDFLTKPFEAERLRDTLREVLRRHDGARRPGARRNGSAKPDFEDFVGHSPAMQDLYRSIECAARSQAPAFICGETGTGKELCARAIHRRGARRSKPFIALDCGAIPKDLMESEIFGHIRGAYTGATGARAGAAKLADGGTLFLDEICEMDPSLQAKLLRFLQSGTFKPLGSDRIETVDVRLVCATNRDPLAEIAAGRCREDLYYRVHVIPVHLPPLRERRQDILPIARHFLARFAPEEGKGFVSFAPVAKDMLEAHDWPGNVRQLQNVVRSVTVLHDGEIVTPAMLPAALYPVVPPPRRSEADGALRTPCDEGVIRPLRLMEKELIEDAIACCGGNVVEAAKRLEISPATIYRKRSAWRH